MSCSQPGIIVDSHSGARTVLDNDSFTRCPWRRQGGYKLNWLANNPPSLTELLLGPIVVAFVGAIVGLVYLGIDRVLVARMQARVGPPVAQPFRDVSKLMMKESIIPNGFSALVVPVLPPSSASCVICPLLYIPLSVAPRSSKVHVTRSRITS
jgi:NADH:ubiquinone oxidoreductase subunit H